MGPKKVVMQAQPTGRTPTPVTAAGNSLIPRTGRPAGCLLAELAGSHGIMIAVASAVVLCLTGCSGGSSTPTAPVSPSATPSLSASPSASTSAAPTGVLTGSELVWLQAIDREQAKITNALAKEPATPSAMQMLAVASALRGCTTTVTRIGRPSDPRLLPVFESMMKACAQFAKAARCQTTLAVSNDPAQLNEAASCISATTLAGGKEMATAEEAIIRLEHPGG
jgi:hypothetical protein